MAFVDIIKPKSPMGVENRLRPYKRGEAEITSDVCYEVLQATNFGRSLRDMLDCMAKLPDEVLSGEKFKEILIAVLAGREQPDNVVERVPEAGRARRICRCGSLGTGADTNRIRGGGSAVPF